jgi:hypothetical protein
MCFSSGGASDRYASEQRAAEQVRKSQINRGMGAIESQFNKFDNKFYDQQSQNYLDFAMPQVNQQYGDATRGLGYALARQGIGASSEGNRRYGNLLQDYQLNRQGVVDKSRDVAATARSNIEAARSGVIQDLYSTADPAAAAKSALSKAQYLAVPQAPSAVGQLFVNALDGLNTYQSAKSDAEAYRGALSANGVSGMPTGSGRNIGG